MSNVRTIRRKRRGLNIIRDSTGARIIGRCYYYCFPTLIDEILHNQELLDMLDKIYCRYCGAAEIWLDYSDFDYADPNSKPIPRNVTDDQYHTCISKQMVRLLERGLLG